MDAKKTGAFIAQLRKEKNMTQQELGEKLFVTNKTISRWENGNYMPDIDTLQALSQEFNISINELLSGERLNESTYIDKAEENLKGILRTETFSLEEKCLFFKQKWKREHELSRILSLVILLAIAILGIVYSNMYLFVPAVLAIIGINLFFYNRMMAYVESHAYDGSGKDSSK